MLQNCVSVLSIWLISVVYFGVYFLSFGKVTNNYFGFQNYTGILNLQFEFVVPIFSTEKGPAVIIHKHPI